MKICHLSASTHLQPLRESVTRFSDIQILTNCSSWNSISDASMEVLRAKMFLREGWIHVPCFKSCASYEAKRLDPVGSPQSRSRVWKFPIPQRQAENPYHNLSVRSVRKYKSQPTSLHDTDGQLTLASNKSNNRQRSRSHTFSTVVTHLTRSSWDSSNSRAECSTRS